MRVNLNLDELPSFGKGSEGVLEIPGGDRCVRAIQDSLEASRVVPEVGQRCAQRDDLLSGAVRQDSLRFRLRIPGELQRLPVLVRLRRDDRLLQELRGGGEIGPS